MDPFIESSKAGRTELLSQEWGQILLLGSLSGCGDGRHGVLCHSDPDLA